MHFDLRKPVRRSTSRFGADPDSMPRRGIHHRPLRCEQLEDRRLLSGVTLITHGFGGNVDGWVAEMANAIFSRPDLAIEQPRYTISVTDPGHDNGPLSVAQTNFTGPSPTALDTDYPEIMVLLDWSDVAGSFPAGYHRNTFEVAAAVVEALVAPSFLGGLPGAVAELPFHLIGHSRGGSLVGEIAHVLGEKGIWVDQVTTLDPHPVDGIRDPFWIDYGDAPMTSWENVVFWDNYWRTDGDQSLDFTGETINNVYDIQLEESRLETGGYSSIPSEHSDVHLWYHGTVDTSTNPPANDGEQDVPNNWYDGSHPSRTGSGYYFSRVVGGSRPAEGLANVLGGTAIRTDIDWSGAIWPNLLDLRVDAADNLFYIGESIPLKYYYQDAGSGATVTYYLDQDRNPLNNNATEVFSQNLPQTGEVPVSRADAIPTGSISAGAYHVYAKIRDAGGRARYAYADDPVLIGEFPAVTNTLDSGPGSLREAILASNAVPGLDTITFNIAGAGAQTIHLLSALPTITDSAVIDGTTQPGFAGNPIIELNGNSLSDGHGLFITCGNSTVRGLVINRFPVDGIMLSTDGGNVLEGNFIGTDVTGTIALGNRRHGVSIVQGSDSNRVGTNGDGIADVAERNIISGNTSDGVFITGGGTDSNLVAGNYIGTDATGTVALGNMIHGVSIADGAQSNRIGTNGDGAHDEAEGNLISRNAENGIAVANIATINNAICGNSIFSNGRLAIDLAGGTEDANGVTQNDANDTDAGPQNLQNYPELTRAAVTEMRLSVRGTLISTPSSAFRVELFSNDTLDPSGYGEGKHFLGAATVTTNSGGIAFFEIQLVTPVSVGEFITATATDPQNNTSEFSQGTVVVHDPIAGRYLFYNNSVFDGNNIAANSIDDAAIAIDKQALLPGETASFVNYTSYPRGINGIMVDILGLADPVAVADGDLSEFDFRYGNNDTPGDWLPAPDPVEVTVRDIGGGVHRITFVWADKAIPNKNWVQVTVKQHPNTGLAADDVFYFGNTVGENTGDFRVDYSDAFDIIWPLLGTPLPIGPDHVADINRDGRIDYSDVFDDLWPNLSGPAPLKPIHPPALPVAPLQSTDSVFNENSSWEIELMWFDQVHDRSGDSDEDDPLEATAVDGVFSVYYEE